jgi:excisionase family DNA binding protein
VYGRNRNVREGEALHRTKHDEVNIMSRISTPNTLEGRVKTLDEVASLLRISRGSAYEAAKRKEIPTIRIGRRLLVPSDALERLLSGEIRGGGTDEC